MADSQPQEPKEGYMYIKLKTYLDELEILERAKPESQRRAVPTLTELATVAGIHKGTISRLVTGQINSLNLDVGRAIFDELYRRGFRPDANDLLGYMPPEDVGRL